jgi:hypothetical protein
MLRDPISDVFAPEVSKCELPERRGQVIPKNLVVADPGGELDVLALGFDPRFDPVLDRQYVARQARKQFRPMRIREMLLVIEFSLRNLMFDTSLQIRSVTVGGSLIRSRHRTPR